MDDRTSWHTEKGAGEMDSIQTPAFANITRAVAEGHDFNLTF